MTLLGDTIMITSRSSGLCAGCELSGQRKWTTYEKLNCPFDLDLFRSDNGEQLLFITDPGKTGKLLLKAVYHLILNSLLLFMSFGVYFG